MPLIFLEAELVSAEVGLLAQISAGGLSLRLFQNNYVPVDTSLLADFTIATFSGYANNAAVMGGPALVGQFAVSNSPQYDFTVAAGGVTNVIYGYYVVDNATGKVSWAERFSAPISMVSIGDKISILLNLTLTSANH